MKRLILILTVLIMTLSNAFGKERKIYVTRHCQAGGKEIKPFEFDAAITRLGVVQSQKLGTRLKDAQFKGRIYASPYFRTTATACHAAEVCGAKVYPDARVQEKVSRTGGNMSDGATLEQLRKLFPNQIADDAQLPYPWLIKVEEDYFTTQQARLEKALDEILAACPDDDLLFVVHAGGVAALCNILSKRAGMAKRPSAMTWNCALFTFSLDDKGIYRFDGYDISFMDESEVTSNHKTTLLERKVGKDKDVKAGVDYKVE